jgi:hypothetical protein
MVEALAERKFTIDGPPQRVWGLIGRVTLDSLNMEQMKYKDETHFSAVLRAKVAFITLPMSLQGEMADISPPTSLAIVLGLKGLGGVINVRQKVSYSLSAVDSNRTEVLCRCSLEKMGGLMKLLLAPFAKNFAGQVFENTEDLLKKFV